MSRNRPGEPAIEYELKTDGSGGTVYMSLAWRWGFSPPPSGRRGKRVAAVVPRRTGAMGCSNPWAGSGVGASGCSHRPPKHHRGCVHIYRRTYSIAGYPQGTRMIELCWSTAARLAESSRFSLMAAWRYLPARGCPRSRAFPTTGGRPAWPGAVRR